MAHLTLQAALYAGNIILMAPSLSSLQIQLTCLADFAGAEHLRVSKEKTLVLLENCKGKVHLDAIELQEITESKYLGINKRTGYTSQQCILHQVKDCYQKA